MLKTTSTELQYLCMYRTARTALQ